MDVTELKHQIYQLNKEEEFYKEQYEAREAGQIHAYIAARISRRSYAVTS